MKILKKMIRNKEDQIIKNIIKISTTKINVKSGLCRFNYKCHMNAVHDAINNNENSIAMCFIYNDYYYPNIHVINLDNEGNYIDNTLGRWSETYEYYLIKLIEKKYFFEVDDIFIKYRQELKSKMPFYIRWLSDWNY